MVGLTSLALEQRNVNRPTSVPSLQACGKGRLTFTCQCNTGNKFNRNLPFRATVQPYKFSTENFLIGHEIVGLIYLKQNMSFLIVNNNLDRTFVVRIHSWP